MDEESQNAQGATAPEAPQQPSVTEAKEYRDGARGEVRRLAQAAWLPHFGVALAIAVAYLIAGVGGHVAESVAVFTTTAFEVLYYLPPVIVALAVPMALLGVAMSADAVRARTCLYAAQAVDALSGVTCLVLTVAAVIGAALAPAILTLVAFALYAFAFASEQRAIHAAASLEEAEETTDDAKRSSVTVRGAGGIETTVHTSVSVELSDESVARLAKGVADAVAAGRADEGHDGLKEAVDELSQRLGDLARAYEPAGPDQGQGDGRQAQGYGSYEVQGDTVVGEVDQDAGDGYDPYAGPFDRQ